MIDSIQVDTRYSVVTDRTIADFRRAFDELILMGAKEDDVFELGTVLGGTTDDTRRRSKIIFEKIDQDG